MGFRSFSNGKIEAKLGEGFTGCGEELQKMLDMVNNQ